MSVIAIPEVLREKLRPEGAEALVELLRESARLARDRADFLRWLFVFWVGQAGVVLTLVLGTLFAFFRLVSP